jgi:hypothetical protein
LRLVAGCDGGGGEEENELVDAAAEDEVDEVEADEEEVTIDGRLPLPEEEEAVDDRLNSALVVAANFGGGSLTSPNFTPLSISCCDGEGVRGGERCDDDEVNKLLPSSVP